MNLYRWGRLFLFFLCVGTASCALRDALSQENVFSLSVPWSYEKLNGTAAPTPTPTATPEPGTPDFIVAPEGGDFTTIDTAYTAASCGQLIWVRNGTYTLTAKLNLSKTCTLGNEITIQNYPDESPVVTCNDPNTGTKRVEFNGQYNVWDGIEVKGCYEGFKVYTSNNTIQNSKIHHNLQHGILIPVTNVELSGIKVHNNEIYHNGQDEATGDNTCRDGTNPKLCHGIYISDSGCNGTDGIEVTDNHIHDHAGRALQFNGEGCASWMDGTIVTGNTFENNSWNMVLFYQVRNSVITGNTFILNSWPTTNDSKHTHIAFYDSPNNTFYDNTLSATNSSVLAIRIMDEASETQTSVDLNDWTQQGNGWTWNGSDRTDFSTQYKSVTGWDASGTIN